MGNEAEFLRGREDHLTPSPVRQVGDFIVLMALGTAYVAMRKRQNIQTSVRRLLRWISHRVAQSTTGLLVRCGALINRKLTNAARSILLWISGRKGPDPAGRYR
jgi:hypothetical protein